MRHATIWAIAFICGVDQYEFRDWNCGRTACDWTRPCLNDGFFGSDAMTLLGLRNDVAEAPPDCPACSLFVDLALIARGEAQQALVNAALDAERKSVAA